MIAARALEEERRRALLTLARDFGWPLYDGREWVCKHFDRPLRPPNLRAATYPFG